MKSKNSSTKKDATPKKRTAGKAGKKSVSAKMDYGVFGDALAQAEIGSWRIEIDEGEEPRMYADATMRKLIGLAADADLTPEETYRAWFDRVDDAHRDAVAEGVSHMMNGEMAEIQYPWHHPDGRTIVVRCGGIRDASYAKGARVAGIHQWVTTMHHVDRELEAQRRKLGEAMADLETANAHERLKADAFDFMLKNDDLEAFVDFFSSRILALYGCDQVIYRDIEGRMILKDKPGTPSLDFSLCKDCPHFAFDSVVYKDGYTAMDDCSVGWNGVPVHKDCPVGASLTYLVHEDGKVFGYIALHYLDRTHKFTDNEKNTFDRVAKFMSMVLSRRKQRIALNDSQIFANSFIDSFVSTYLVNLDTLAYKVYTRTDELKRDYPLVADYTESMKDYAAKAVHPDDRGPFLDFLSPGNLKKILAGQKTVLFQYRDISGGTEKNYVARAVRGARANTAALAFADITGQIKSRTEATRSATNAMLSLLEDLDSVFLIDPETGSYNIFLPGADSIEHYTTMKKEGRNFYDDIPVQANTVIHEGDREKFLAFYSRENLKKIVDTGVPQEIENRWFVKEGLRTIRNKAVPRVDADGKATIILGVWDITDKLDNARAEQEARMLKNFGDMMNAATWSMEIEDDDTISSVSWSDELRHMFGFKDEKDFPDELAAWNDRLHPGDKTRVADNLSRGIKEMDSGVVYHVDYRFKRKDGEYRWYRAYGRIEKSAGDKRKCFGIVIDVSTEKALADQNDRFDVVRNLIRAGLWCFRLNAKNEITSVEYSDDIPTIVNTDRLARRDPKEWQELVHPDDVKASAEAFYAAIADRSGKTVYDVNYRMVDRHGKYNWFHSAGRVIRHEDGTGDFFGIHINVNDQFEAQQKRLLGAIPISPDILAKEGIGLWAFELDEGQPPRMYDDETMLGLVGLDHPVPPEETYHAWYDHIDKDCYQLVHDAVAKMMAGEHAEVQYPWHHPDGHTIIVRCGGVRNPEYTKGIRVEGTHQNVSEVLHYDDAEVKRLKAREIELMHAEFRASAIAYVTEHEGDVKSFIDYFAERLRALIKCDQVIYQDADGNEVVNNAPEFKDFKFDYTVCKRCPHNDYRAPVYAKGMTELEDNQAGFEGVYPPKECPVKSSLARILTLDGKPSGYLAIHYISGYHKFNDYERQTLEEFANLLSLTLSRYAAREENAELQRELALKRQIAEQQKQLEEALSMAQAANRAKTTFLNNMSHDIRTPMNAIIGFTGLAASHIDHKDQVKDYLTKIGQASDHLLSLINDVLDMSRIESGKMNLSEKPENIPDIIRTLKDIVQADIRAKQHDFFIDTVNVNDENVVCDKLRLNQVLLNILSNAIKYTAAGGTISMRITEKTVKPSGYATYEFCIKDNGMGMDEEFLKTIFDPFSRVKSSTVSGIQGTGLGMAITKNIIDMMGGKIDVSSAPGKGTQITVEFDFKLAEAHRSSIAIPELKGLRALVADDDADTCVSIDAMLREIGMRTEWCTSGKEAVFRAQTAHRIGDLFKVYIIDWLMPDMNGIETTRRIRKAIGDDVPIIILTAYDWSDIEDEAREAGVTAFISKPLFPSDLNRVLNSCLGKPDQSHGDDMPECDLSGKKFLLVEDNELNREIATELIKEFGGSVDTAENGAVAVEKMKASKPGDYDIVLMDVQMPVMDGYEATKAIREWEQSVSAKRIPIIALSANAFAEDREASFAAGMDAHVAKPIKVKELVSAISKFA